MKDFRIKAVEYSPDNVWLFVKWPRTMTVGTREKIFKKVAPQYAENPLGVYVPRIMSRRETNSYKIAVTDSDHALERSCEILDSLNTALDEVQSAKEQRKRRKQRERNAERNPIVYSREDCN